MTLASLPRLRRMRGAWIAPAMALIACGGRAPAVGSSDASSGPGAGEPDATAPGWSRQLGVYGDCSFSNVGFASGEGGTLTLTQSSSGALTVAYALPNDDARSAFSLDFTPTSATSATLAPANPSMPWEAFCFSGPIATDSGLVVDPSPTPLTLDLTGGALTYDAETVFVSFVGTVDVDVECEGSSAGSITCSRE